MSYIKVNGIRLFCEHYGKGEPLLFIHGLGAGCWTWQHQIDFFKDRYQVWVPEMRGHGRSDKPAGPYSMEGFAADLNALIGEMKLDKVHVAGLSMGGIIAYEMASRYPEKIKSLTIVNSGPEIRQDHFFTRFLIWQRQWWTSVLDMETLATFLAWHLFPDAEQNEIRQKFIERWKQNDKEAYQASFNAMVNWEGGRHPENIHCPVLFITSPADYTSVQMKKDFIAAMPSARLAVVPDSHHVIPLDQPQKLNEELDKFLNALKRSADKNTYKTKPGQRVRFTPVPAFTETGAV